MKSITSSSSAAINSPKHYPTEDEQAAFYAAHEALSFRDTLDDLSGDCYWMFRAICDNEPGKDGTVTIEISSRRELILANIMAAVFPHMQVEWQRRGVWLVVSRPSYFIDGRTAAIVGLRGQCERQEMPYKDYLQTPYWREKRDVVIEAAGHRCQVCNEAGELHVHHRTYERRGHEARGDLIALCADCHKLFHDHRELAKDES